MPKERKRKTGKLTLHLVSTPMMNKCGCHCHLRCCYSPITKKSRREISSEEAVSNDATLLRKILLYHGHCLETLKICRQINSHWNTEASKIIQEHHTTNLIIIRSTTTIKCVTVQLSGAGQAPKTKFATLSQFTDMVQASDSNSNRHSNFPCNNFHISTNDLYETELHKFLTTQGQYIFDLKLSINRCCGKNSYNLRLLRTLLMEQLPQLRKLAFDQIPLEWNNKTIPCFSDVDGKISDNLGLSKLTTLDFKNMTFIPEGILREISCVAINLKSILCILNERNFKLLERLGLQFTASAFADASES